MIKPLPDGNSAIECLRPFFDVDYIISDIDGTLTVGAEPIMSQIKEKIRRLIKRHTYTTVATGRPYRGAKIILEDLGIKRGTPIALYNGGVLIEYDTDNIIYKNCIKVDTLISILHMAEREKVDVYIYTFDMKIQGFGDILSKNHIYEAVYYVGHNKISIDINGINVIPLDLYEIGTKSIVSILVDRSELSEYATQEFIFFLNCHNDISYTDSGNGFIEIRARANCKDIVIRELRQRGDAQKILSIGDNDNDIDLFEAADISVAVHNASENAKNAADYECKNNSAEGFLDMLRVIEQSKRYYNN